MKLICSAFNRSFYVDPGDIVSQWSQDNLRFYSDYLVEEDGLYAMNPDGSKRGKYPVCDWRGNSEHTFYTANLIKKTPEKPVLITDII